MCIRDSIQVPQALIISENLSCENGQAFLTFETNEDLTMITWLGPNGFISNEASIVVEVAGAYTLNITGINACKANFEVLVEDDNDVPAIDLSFEGPELLHCDQESLQLMIQEALATFDIQWSGPGILSGANTSNIELNLPGLYSVCVTNAENGCNRCAEIEVDQADLPILELLSMDVTCWDGADGSISIDSALLSGSFEWMLQNSMGEVIDPELLSAGTYEVILTDQFGCQVNESIELLEPEEVVINLNLSMDEQSVDVDISGGTPPYASSWDPDPTPPEAGVNYVITVFDANGCEYIENYMITSSTQLIEESLILRPNPVSDRLYISLDASEDLKLSIYHVSGKLLERREITNGITEVNIESYLAGVYTLVFVDDFGNTHTEKVIKF